MGQDLKCRFFEANTSGPTPTAIIVPGWPGNPDDVLGLGDYLSRNGINVLVFNPRGHHKSEGESSFANTMEDIAAVVNWVQSSDSGFPIEKDLVFLGGYSFGGGMALAYASTDPEIRWIFSIAGTDHAELIRKYKEDEKFAQFLEEVLASTAAPEGPIRFEVSEALRELSENQHVFGLRENANNLADRDILLIGGWEDENVTIEEYLLPLYRELRKNESGEVTFQVFHDAHEFAEEREQISEAVLSWIKSKVASA
jgi:pimeloyl-ACP methyl ester carboxylesterase